MNIVSWNTNRRRDVAAQVAFLRSRAADIVALQEVTAATAPQFTSALTDLHYDVRSTVNSDSSRSGPRAYGVLIASRFAMQDRDDCTDLAVAGKGVVGCAGNSSGTNGDPLRPRTAWFKQPLDEG